MDDVLAEVQGGLGRLTLNRPQAINALTVPMMEFLTETLSAWAEDDSVSAVEIVGAGGRGFCSGADVRALRQTVLDGGDYLRFFEVEYALDRLILNYPKPYRAIMTGITMGGGLGISVHGSHRIADATSRFAMPETVIGFHPDVGMLWYLAQGPGEIGTHLALTGTSFGAADALAFGIVDEIFGVAPEPVWLNHRDWIDECYAGNDAVEIARRLAEHPSPAARAAGVELRLRCPMSVAVTLAALRAAANMDGVSAVLDQDLRLARTLIARPDFAEGVRAQLVDKDRNPIWSPSTLAEVASDEVSRLLAG